MFEPKGISFVSALSREEWEEGLEFSIEMGLAKPGETYEDYLNAIRRDPRFIVCGPHDLSNEKPSAEQANSPKNSISESERQARVERIGQGMLESIKKLPPVH
jgi:hypothetical protein